jgi:hypothetical protein
VVDFFNTSNKALIINIMSLKRGIQGEVKIWWTRSGEKHPGKVKP